MLLLIDIGNTNIVVGGYADGKITQEARLATDALKTSDQYCMDLKNLHSLYEIERASVLTPVVAQYASETIQSSAEATHIPENLAACTADADIPDDLEHIDSFIATAYYVTGTTSTGAYTTVGRTLAVNPNIIPYGTQVWMFLDDGTYIGTFTAEDTGSNMMAHPHVVDIYMGADSYNECILWGAQHVNLYTTPAENAAE